ncbi:hypothetical protein I7I48_05910 [Histoplasma ohiense]|nr:hypothetical protein I7I48_05910 [Histoplasma ohiense (nom. inval.)]
MMRAQGGQKNQAEQDVREQRADRQDKKTTNSFSFILFSSNDSPAGIRHPNHVFSDISSTAQNRSYCMQSSVSFSFSTF